MSRLLNLAQPATAAEWRTLILVMLAWDLLTLAVIWAWSQR